MTHDTNIPQGYKATALGIIPQEWEVVRFGKVMKCFSGGTPKSSNPNFFGGEIPFIKSGEIHLSTTEQNLSEEGFNQSAAKMVNKGDLLYALYGANSGDCAISKIEGAINQAILCIRTDAFDIPYLLAVLELNRPYYTDVYLQGGQGNLSAEIVKSYMIAVPPISEQRKIAEVLGVWDEAISMQSRLVDKLAQRKRGLMQRLLTAQLRLPGFSEPWKKVKFCELFTKSKKTADPLKEYEVLSVTKEGIVAQKSYFNKDIASEDTSKYIVVERGDLAMSGLNFWMGSCHVLTNFNEGIISPAYKVFKVNAHNDINFIRDFVRSSMFLQALQGSSVIGASIVRRNLDQEMLYEWTFMIPSLKEQTAIAEVLTAADREIELAKEKLERLRQQKRGLMQQLLTGKKRLKYNI